MNGHPAKVNTIDFNKLRQALISRFGHEYQGIKPASKLDFALYPEFAFLADHLLLEENRFFNTFVSAENPLIQENIRKIMYYDDLLSVFSQMYMLTDSCLQLKTKYVQYIAELSRLQVQVATLLHHQRMLYRDIQLLSADSAYNHYQNIILLKHDIRQLMDRSHSKTGVFGLLDMAKKYFIASI